MTDANDFFDVTSEYKITAHEQPIDFKDSITRLEKRAKACQWKVWVIGVFVSAVIIATALVVAWKVLQSDTGPRLYDVQQSSKSDLSKGSTFFVAGTEKLGWGLAVTPETLNSQLLARISLLMKDRNDENLSPEQLVLKESELKQAIDLYERLKTIHFENETIENVDYTSFVERLIFSAGAVAFIIMFIQIGLMFGRYYARLAEFYEAQASALRASDGIPNRAYAFMRLFSPNTIDLGKTPATIYEKAIDGLIEVAKSKS